MMAVIVSSMKRLIETEEDGDLPVLGRVQALLTEAMGEPLLDLPGDKVAKLLRRAARLTGWRLDIASEAEADAAREAYLAERAERGSVEAVAEEAEEAGEADEAAPAVDFDPDLLRKLEEFKRERLGGGEEA